MRSRWNSEEKRMKKEEVATIYSSEQYVYRFSYSPPLKILVRVQSVQMPVLGDWLGYILGD